VWSENNGCHVSQEDVWKLRVALFPAFTDAYSKIRISEQGSLLSNILSIMKSEFLE